MKTLILKQKLNFSFPYWRYPGPVFTKPSVEKETIEKLGWFGKKMAVSPEEPGEIAVSKTLKKVMIIVPGFLAKTVSVMLRTLPRKWIAYIYYKLGFIKTSGLAINNFLLSKVSFIPFSNS